MKNYLVLVSFLLVMACSDEHPDFDTMDVRKEALQVLAREKGVMTDIDLSLFDSLSTIIIEESYTTPEGLFLVTETFLLNEHGIFVPRKGVKVNVEAGSDPEFILIGNNVYRYSIKG